LPSLDRVGEGGDRESGGPRMTTLALIVLAVLSLLGLGIWLHVTLTWAARQIDDDLVLKPPVYRYDTADEALAVRTRKRREAADAIHTRAHKVESGTKVTDVLKLVKK
jgi:hypothetical protein